MKTVNDRRSFESTGGAIYYRPVATTIRLEAVWAVKIAYARFARKCIDGLLKSLASVSKQDYKPSGANHRTAGYLASLVFMSMEEVLDGPETTPYPDW